MLYQLSHFRSKDRYESGAESQIRTGDTAIFSRVLYQLSYLGPSLGPISPSAAGGYHALGGRLKDGQGPSAGRSAVLQPGAPER